VHGLWPQYEDGYPQYCARPAPRLDRGLVASMLDLMPSRRLVVHAWDKHGTCAGLPPPRYFAQLRQARERVRIPDNYLEPGVARETAPAEVEEAFRMANPGLGAGAISVTCDGRRLSEVRICLTRDLQFRDCPGLERRSCRRATLRMPAAR
jgi:ribonuclease T2